MRFLKTLAAAAAVSLVAVLPAASSPLSVFEADLDGAQEVPGVVTAANGSARLTLNAQANRLSFRMWINGLKVADLLDVGGFGPVHLHNAPAGQNGPVVVPFRFADSMYKDTTDGFKLIVKRADFSALAPGVDINTFQKDVSQGNYYINVHTQTHNSGEVRGQLVPVPAPASALLLLGGLGALAIGRRRRRAQ